MSLKNQVQIDLILIRVKALEVRVNRLQKLLEAIS